MVPHYICIAFYRCPTLTSQPALHLLTHRGGQFRLASTSADVKVVLSARGKLSRFCGSPSSWEFLIAHEAVPAVSIHKRIGQPLADDPITETKSPLSRPGRQDEVKSSTFDGSSDDIVSGILLDIP